MELDPNTNLGLCLSAAIRDRDADMLHSLIEANSTDEKYVRNITAVYNRLSLILSDSDKNWFRFELGGSQTTNLSFATTTPDLPYSPQPKDTLVPLGELAKVLKVEIEELMEYLAVAPHPIYCFVYPGKEIDTSRYFAAFEDVVAIAVGLQSFLAERKIGYYLSQIEGVGTR